MQSVPDEPIFEGDHDPARGRQHGATPFLRIVGQRIDQRRQNLPLLDPIAWPAFNLDDACIVVASRRDIPHVVKALAKIGYVHRGELGVPDRAAFQPPPSLPKHHLYASPRGSLSLRNHLGLRDYLRANPDATSEYGALKASLARTFPDDIDAYIAGKTQFILAVLREIGFSEEEIAGIRSINQPEQADR